MIVTTLQPNKIQKISLYGNIEIVMGGAVFFDDAVDFSDGAVDWSPKNCDSYGFVYGTTTQGAPGNVDPSASGYDSYGMSSEEVGDGEYTRILATLVANTLYYIRAFAHNPDGWVYGDEVVIRTVGYVKDQFTFKAKDTTFTFKAKDTSFTLKEVR